MTRNFKILGVGLLLASTAGGANTFTPALSHLEVFVPKAGLLSFAGHEHTIEATEFSGTLSWEDDKPASLELSVPVAGLRVTDSKLSEEDREQVRADMVGEKVLLQSQFPVIRFEADRITVVSEEQWRVEGTVTVRGQSTSTGFPVEIEQPGENAVRAKGTVKLELADFGIKPVTALGGMIKTGDTVEVRFHFISQETKE